jgi:hypothetical protein
MSSKLADDPRHSGVSLPIARFRSLRGFVRYRGRPCFGEFHQLPTNWFVMNAASTHLPAAHDIFRCLGDADSVDFNAAAEAVIFEFEDSSFS